MSDEAHQALSRFLAEKVALPGADRYQHSTKSYWIAQESSLSPCCVITPTDRDDVLLALRLILKGPEMAVSAAERLGQDERAALAAITSAGHRFAIRSGGHTLWHKASNIDGGVTIDMRNLNTISVSSDRTVVSVGAGAIWREVYRKLDPIGLTVAGGRAADVGVAGLILGGGISYYSARKGFACDNVRNIEVVLASGQVVNANRNENPDLWAALKGGWNNFGIVTRFELEAFPTDGLWGGQVSLADSSSPKMLEAFINLNKKDGFDEYASIWVVVSHSQDSGFLCSSSIHYTKPEAYPKTFEPFTSDQPQLLNTLRFADQTSFTEELVEYNPLGKRGTFTTNTFGNDLEFVLQVYKKFKEEINSHISGLPDVVFMWVLQPVSKPLLEASEKRGGNWMGLSPSEAPLILSLNIVQWQDPAHDEIVHDVLKRLTLYMTELSKARGIFNDWTYANYAASWQDPLAGYGAENVEKMRAVSRKYDPDGVFQEKVPGGFKLFV